MAYVERTRVRADDSPSVDAFSRWRISEPITLFAVQQGYDRDPLLLETGNTGTGVAPGYSTDSRMTTLSCTAGTGVSFVQSYQYHPYQPGKSQLVFITGVVGAAVAAVVKDFGYFDANNGIIFRQNGTSGLQFVRRTSTSGSVVNNTVTQGSWNIDNFDGTGPSGVTFVVGNTFILVIDLQFLAMGRVRIGFDVDGIIHYAHQFLNANVLNVPYMQTATLPIQALVTSTASGSTATCQFKCAAVMSEGGFDTEVGYRFATPSVSATAGNNTRTACISIRPKTTFGGITNRRRFILDTLGILVTGNNPVLWELCVGSTFSVAPTYANVDGTYSGFEYSSASGTLTAAGTVIAAGYCAVSNQNKDAVAAKLSSYYPISLDRAGAVRALGTLSLILTGLGGTSASQALFNYIEIP